MKNIQVIDGAENCVYDIFAVENEDFKAIFPNETDVAFIDEVYERHATDPAKIDKVLSDMWKRPVKKNDVIGIYGTLFYDMDHKKVYYPTRKDAEAVNPDGTQLR